MLAGYSEVVAFNQNIQGDEFFYEDDYAFIDEDMVKLPPHLQPHFSIPHPWKNNASFEEDFILISEFSEQEGPKPLISIPTEAGGKFDINAFAVKVMAVDYQMVGSCSFSVAMDTHIVIEDELEGAFAYVHHFTLYDIYARGFVRPFCMAYITPDKKKIMDNFEELLRKFKKVSTYFKYGNRLLFVKDLEHHILDLHYTKDKFLKYKKDENKKEEDDINDSEIGSSTVAEYFTYTTAEHIDHNIKEISNIYNIVKPLMTNKKLESRFKRLEDKARDTKSCCLHSATRISLREDGYHSDGPTTPSTPSKRNSIPECCCAVDAIYQPKLVKTDSTRRFDKALRTLHELCNWGAKEGLNRLRKIHKCHSRDPITVRVESQESDLIDPPSTLLTIGRSVVINFLHNIDLSGSTSCWPLYEVCRSKLRCNSLNERKWFAEQHENISLCSSDTVDSYISYSEDGTDRLPQSSYDAAFVLGSAFVSL
ncbi:guanine nucleotide exchange protein smcr8a-like, partial [Saccoglossus kowalevskii]|uniref:Smith-Magenis syndrome chromosomal region candidate gene 8 protein homolog n=1 Tax=Saccoglossus kowalevskii TaxID=10224 RepID=A0ABM0MZM1_SACKO